MTRFKKKLCVWGLIGVSLLIGSPGWAQMLFHPGKSSIRVLYQDRILTYETESISVLPKETIRLKLVNSQNMNQYQCWEKDQSVTPTREGVWIWQAPTIPGIYTLVIKSRVNHPAMTLTIFVMEPFQNTKQGRMGGYRIGHYPRSTTRGSVSYQPPKGFIKVTNENKHTKVSPHFELGQFVCKQTNHYPQYLLLDAKLILKCEQVLARLNRNGYTCQTLVVMSGFRTPYYNRRLGNVRFSSHVWGRAADVYVDENHDGMMDDLNQDGLENYLDAAILYKMIDQIETQTSIKSLIGGLGLYAKNRHHGSFVHLDVRGKKARWGIAIKKVKRANNSL